MILITRHRATDRRHWATHDVAQVNIALRPMGLRLCGRCRVIKPREMWSRTSSCCSPCHSQRTRLWERSDPARTKVGQATRSARRRALERQQSVIGAPVTWRLLEQKHRYWAGRCWLCGRRVPDSELNWDHVIALARGGLNIVANLRPTHALCNTRKGQRDIPLRHIGATHKGS